MNGDNEDAIYLGSIPKHLNNPRWTSIRLYTPYKFCRDWNYERKKVKFRFLLACSLGEKMKFSFCFACALGEDKNSRLGITYRLGGGGNSEFCLQKWWEWIHMYKKEERGGMLGENGLRWHHLPIQ